MTLARSPRSENVTDLGTRGTARRKLVGAALGLLAFASLVGCLSPTLPLPPPSRPHVSAPDENGMIRITGKVDEPGAKVTVLNEATNRIVGAITDETAAYDLEMAASEGDQLAIRQSVGTSDSTPTYVTVPGSDDLGSSAVPATPQGGAGPE